MRNLFLNNRKAIIAFFVILMGLAGYAALNLKFIFNFEQFFPEGDEDLEFFNEFIADFETDDNFLLVAVESKPTVFDSSFLQRFHDFSLEAKKLPHVVRATGLTQVKYPVKTPFGYSSIPAIHRKDPSKYGIDKKILMEDERMAGTLIDTAGQSLVLSIKNIERIGLEESQELIAGVKELLAKYEFDDYHMLGRAYFTSELVKMQLKEIVLSSVVSIVLVFLIMIFLYRRFIGVLIGLSSIGVGLLLFLGLLSIMGRELSVMAALYPVLMLIVGTSDVIHIMTKYIDELKSGANKEDAIMVTIKEIGLATLLTSLTTAAGFLTLLSSRIVPIREFGVNAALGVIVAYVTVVLLTTSLLSLFSKDQIIKENIGTTFWDALMAKWYQWTIDYRRQIVFASVIFIGFCAYGMTQVTTNFKIDSNLPKVGKVTDDFYFFEDHYGGFRPMEFAIIAQGDHLADDYQVMTELNKLEEKLRATNQVGAIMSPGTIYKSIERMNKGDRLEAYRFPATEKDFLKSKKLVDRMSGRQAEMLLSKDKKKSRISTRIQDIGSNKIRALGEEIDLWIDNNLDASLVEIKRTGTGVIVDKNADYVREDLIYGLGFALLIVSLLMALLFRSAKMLFIALIPNIVPLLFAASLLGYLGIELETGISIVFAIVFGIAVDDTIHFLSKYKLARLNGKDQEAALRVTFAESGKAICLTSVILFFGFLILLFSNNPPSVSIGLLISVTLVSALICDLFMIPILIRKFIK